MKSCNFASRPSKFFEQSPPMARKVEVVAGGLSWLLDNKKELFHQIPNSPVVLMIPVIDNERNQKLCTD